MREIVSSSVDESKRKSVGMGKDWRYFNFAAEPER